MSHRRLRLVLLLLALSAAGAMALWLRRERPPAPLPADALPAGRWHRPEGLKTPVAPDAEERARLLSLPYLDGSQPAADSSGVRVHDVRSAPGVNLYTSGHAPEALLIDADGHILHRWSYRFRDAFPRRRPTQESHFFRTAALLPDGELLAMFQGGGLVRLDRHSRALWVSEVPLYNDVTVAGDVVWSLAKRAMDAPDLRPDGPVLEDSVVALDLATGRPLVRHSILAAIRASEHAHLLPTPLEAADVLHANAVRVLGSELEAAVPALSAGRLLVSVREISLLLALDAGSGELVWARTGPWSRQHDPRPQSGGRLLLFDNLGFEGSSRALELDLATGDVAWQYPASPGLLRSPEAGAVQRFANGNTLITESENGRALEVTTEGEVVWEVVSPHRAGPGGELVATLFEVRRLERPGWLDDPRAGGGP